MLPGTQNILLTVFERRGEARENSASQGVTDNDTLRQFRDKPKPVYATTIQVSNVAVAKSPDLNS